MKPKFLPQTWWGWILWLMLVGIVGLLVVRSLFLWLYPDAPGYLDECVWDNGPCEEGATWKSTPTPLKRFLND